eukprot:5064109-Amphidinium_carterae.1
MPTDMTLTAILDAADVLHESEALFDDRPQEENDDEVAAEDIPCEEVEECTWEGEEEAVEAPAASSTEVPETPQANNCWNQQIPGFAPSVWQQATIIDHFLNAL